MKGVMNRIGIWVLALLAGGMIACSDKQDEKKLEEPVPSNAVEKQVTLNAALTYQTVAGFGASDAWQPAWVGKYWTGSRDRLSELLFSQEIADGQAKGIGLSMWRVNLGAGSAEQGDASGINTVTRRAESFLTADGSYDWEKCMGQRYFMQRARELGVEKFILFSNSPPVQYTYNGQGRSDRGGHANLKSEYFDDFADYLVDVTSHFHADGYNITHISPVNEPQYNWDGHDQEGSGWTNEEIATLMRELDRSLTERSLPVDILLGESGDWEYFYKSKGDRARSYVISDFFNPERPTYIGDLKHLKNLISGHSYWTDGSWDGMRSVRSKVAQIAREYDLEVWQSEWSMIGDGYSSSEYVGHENATTMDIALYMSKVIHNDLTVGGVTSWSFWTAMDVAHWGHQNRFLLISLTPDGGEWGDVMTGDGTFAATPTLWVLGNYSRFIRPGYKRIELSMNESRSFFGSGYLSPDGKQLVVVYTNLSDKPVQLIETREGWDSSAAVKTYTTSSVKELQEAVTAPGKPVVLDAASVTTVVYQL